MLVASTTACVEEAIPPTCVDDRDAACEQTEDPAGCVCADIYLPICGVDGKTYGNACEAECVDVAKGHEGVCERPLEPNEPAVDASTSALDAAAATPDAGASTLDAGGPARDSGRPALDAGASCVCRPVYEPVCGADGRTYGHSCEAACVNARVAYEGECRDAGNACACTKEYRPVCGADGVTYGNRCMAGCAGVAVAREGSCVEPSDTCSYDGKTYRAGDSFPSRDGCNSCSCGADGLVACTLKACACDYGAPGRRWVARSAEQCTLVKFTCVAGQRPFFDACGCGCEAEPGTCRVAGCSSQLCVGPGDPDVSTCEWREQYACYRTATCELQSTRRCGWTASDELRRCLDAASP